MRSEVVTPLPHSLIFPPREQFHISYALVRRIGEVEDDRLKAVYAWRTGRLIHDYFGKNALALHKSYTPSLNLSLGTSRSYNRSENVTREYAGSMIRAGELANLTAAERDLTVKGSTIESKDVSLAAKGNVRLAAGENTSVTTTANKYSSASVGASFGINGLSDISIDVNRAKGNSKETYTSYTPALIRAEENAVITSGKDTDIIGSKVQGDKVTARVGRNLNIETLQEKETYEEQNTSAGFGISWSGKTKTKNASDTANAEPSAAPEASAPSTANDGNLLPANANQQNHLTLPGKKPFTNPNFTAPFSKGTINSHYRSARDQAGIFAGSGGFDIYVEKNTDLKGALIASKASPDKNKLSTGTFSFSDLKNEADYHAKDSGFTAQIKPTLRRIKETGPKTEKSTEKLKIVQGFSVSPSISTEVQGSASSTTKSAVAPGTIDIRENTTQDISALRRDTENALNELGRIFDKKSVEEQKELVNVFREEAFHLAHNLPDDGSGRKVLIHTFIGGLISQLSGAGFASGAAGAGLNEALINNLNGVDPALAQVISALIGAAAAKAINGNATAGAIAAASGTKWNKYERVTEILEQLNELNESEEYKELKDGEYFIRYGTMDGEKVAVAIDKDGKVFDLEVIHDAGIDRMMLHGNPLTKKGEVYTVDKMDHYGEPNAKKTGEQSVFRRGDADGTSNDIVNLYGVEYRETKSLEEAKDILRQRVYQEWVEGRTILTDIMRTRYPLSFLAPGAMTAKSLAILGALGSLALKDTPMASDALIYAHLANGWPQHYPLGTFTSSNMSRSDAITQKIRALGAHFSPGETRDIYMSINLNIEPASLDEHYFSGWTKLAMRVHRDMDGKISFNGLAGDAYNFGFHKWKLGDPEYSWKDTFTDTINNAAWVNQSLGYLHPFPWTAEFQGTISLSED